MQKAFTEQGMVIRFHSGEELFPTLEEALVGTSSAWAVVLGIGMLEAAEIGYYNGAEYVKRELEEPHELVALHGTVTMKGGFAPHLHCGLVGPDHVLRGGHLFGARVKVVCEMILQRLDVPMVRKADPSTGLNLLELEDTGGSPT